MTMKAEENVSAGGKDENWKSNLKSCWSTQNLYMGRHWKQQRNTANFYSMWMIKDFTIRLRAQ
jgi:hypothetical protein